MAAAALVSVLAGCSGTNPAGPEPAQTYLVDAAGGGDFLTIQEGINAASDGDTVFIAPGTYTGEDNKNLQFDGSSIVLSGAGERDDVIIDCEGEGRGFFIDGDASPVIENLTVMNGVMPSGGGMYIQGSSPALRNLRFIGNRAWDASGGALYCRNGSPALYDVLFDGNTSEYEGGAMHCAYSSPALSNVVFVGNTAGWLGGAADCAHSSPALSECVFLWNTAPLGGGLFCTRSAPSIDSCTFADNEGDYGSAICCWDQSTPPIAHSIIAYNAPGEALYCSTSLPTTDLCCIYGNGDLNEICGNYSTSMLYEDPLFCDLEGGDLTLSADSPCLPANNQWGILFGALGQGCGLR
jgi:hypothetical protein